jgi:aryl-alcohol dehydrogenase-like predicted oxidoreductase
MDDLVHQGKILYWGTSVWDAEQINEAVWTAGRTNAYRPQVEQPRYNMLDRHIESEIVPTCAQHGIGLTVFSPLAQGILTGKYNRGVPEDSRGATSQGLSASLTDQTLDKVRQLTGIATELNITTAQLALAWILRLPEISCVITGATRPEHIKTNAAAVQVKFDDEVLNRIEAILVA